MTSNVPVFIKAKIISKKWYYLHRSVQIIHEDAGWKAFGKTLTCAMMGLPALGNYTMTVERLRNHALAIEKQLDEIAGLIKLNNKSELMPALNNAQVNDYGDQLTIPVRFKTKDQDFSLAAFASMVYRSTKDNAAMRLARAYEHTCLRAYGIFGAGKAKEQDDPNLPAVVAPRPDAKQTGQLTPNVPALAFGIGAAAGLAPATGGLSLLVYGGSLLVGYAARRSGLK